MFNEVKKSVQWGEETLTLETAKDDQDLPHRQGGRDRFDQGVFDGENGHRRDHPQAADKVGIAIRFDLD